MGGTSSKTSADTQQGDRQANSVNVDPESTNYSMENSSSGVHLIEFNFPSLGIGTQAALLVGFLALVFGLAFYAYRRYRKRQIRDKALHEYYANHAGDDLASMSFIPEHVPIETIHYYNRRLARHARRLAKFRRTVNKTDTEKYVADLEAGSADLGEVEADAADEPPATPQFVRRPHCNSCGKNHHRPSECVHQDALANRVNVCVSRISNFRAYSARPEQPCKIRD